MYETAEEARQKLEHSVVLFDNQPVYIQGTAGKRGALQLIYKGLPWSDSEQGQLAAIDDPRWDFRSGGSKLGYTDMLNTREGHLESVFISRMPVRHSRQGLDDRTVYISIPDTPTNDRYDFQSLIRSEHGLRKVICNQYDSVQDVFKKITSDNRRYKSLPFSRKLALLYDRVSPPVLLYRNEKVGYTEDGVTFKLANHKKFLTEELVDMTGLKIVG